MIEEFEEAVLTRDVPEKDLLAGDVGTVVMVHRKEHGEIGGYTLEFMTLSGDTIAVATVEAQYVREGSEGDIIHIRQGA